MVSTRLVPLILLMLGGCAASDGKQSTAEVQRVCTREYRVGSSIPVVNCEAPMTDEERQRSIEELRNGARPVPTKTVGGKTGG